VALNLGPDGSVGIALQRRRNLCPLSLAGQIIERVDVLQVVFPYLLDRPAQLFIFVRDGDGAQNLREPGI
jgi:hypothetical protein